jgi:hypothetical protein
MPYKENKMDDVKQLKSEETRRAPQNNRAIGAVLIIIGLVALAGQFLTQFDLSYLILPGLGIGFLAWGILSRQAGLLIPGGILSGIGLGVILTQAVGRVEMESELGAAVFMLSFAAGWGLITLLSAVFTDETHWWPLIPGGIMAAIGGALLIGGPALAIMEFFGRVWPVLLIVAGAYLIWRQRRG